MILFFLLGVGVAVLAGTLSASIDIPSSVTHASEPKAQLVLPESRAAESVLPQVTQTSPEGAPSSLAESPWIKDAMALGQHHLSEATQQAVQRMVGGVQKLLLLKAQLPSREPAPETSNHDEPPAPPQRVSPEAQCAVAYRNCSLMCPGGGEIDAGFDLGFEDDTEVCEDACNDGKKVCLAADLEGACGDFLGACRYRCMTEASGSGDCEDACELAEASCSKHFKFQKATA